MPIALPITPADALSRVIRPGLELLPSKMGGERAEVMLLAIALQESGLRTRVQDGGGPARGLWMFERGGIGMCTISGASCWGVLEHPATVALVRRLCGARGVPDSSYSIWASVAGDDLLAAGIARLLLLTDPKPLPELGDADGAWRYYVENWRPGRPRPLHWIGHHVAAVAAVTGADTEPA